MANQSPITNTQTRESRNHLVPCSPDPLQPDSLVPRFSLVLTVSCLLYSVFYPYPPSCPACHHPIFSAFSVTSVAVPLRLCVFVATSQLCKTNPIPKTPKSPQPLMPRWFTPILHSAPNKKNKPNQTQFIAAKPPANPKQTQFATQHEIRNTTY